MDFPRNAKEFNMFVLAAKSAEDYIKMSGLLDRAEEIGFGSKCHASRVINLDESKVIFKDSMYHTAYELNNEVLTDFDELYLMIRNLKITILDRPAKVEIHVHQGTMLMPMAYFVEIGVGPSNCPTLTFNNEMWHNFMHNEKSIIDYIILIDSKNRFPCRIKIEFDYIDPYIDNAIDIRFHMLDQMIIKTKERWFNSIEDWHQSYPILEHLDKADKCFSREFLWGDKIDENSVHI